MLSLLAPLLIALLAILPSGCSQGPGGGTSPTPLSVAPQQQSNLARTAEGLPLVRVRVLEAQTSVRLTASADPTFSTTSDPRKARLAIAGRGTFTVAPTATGWSVGGVGVAAGVLSLHPSADGTLAVNNARYRGHLQLVPVGGGKFDVINHVDIDGYLKSVVSREMLRNWSPEAYRAQAVVARTYALYEVATNPPKLHFDVHDDERSQVYGGLNDETPASVAAVDATRGIVATYDNRIFKAYFSSTCGGIGQSAQDAFNDPYMPALAEKHPGALCADSPRYNWGPVMLTKPEVTRRLRLWGQRRNRVEASIGPVQTIAASHVNRFGRPVRYQITTSTGQRYSMMAEELRTALNTGGQGRTVWSGYMQITDNGPSFTISGKGSGHAVGMCQYCAQSLATRGYRHEDIVRYSYPGCRLVRAY